MNDDPCFMTATDLRRRIARRDLSPVEVVQAVLARAERLQPILNCFITLCPEQAMADARTAEQAIMRGNDAGLLCGIPYAVKDLVNTRGLRTTFGALPFADHVPGQDAEAVARLRRHGAILFGKTTTSEFGSKCMTDSPLFGRTRNAWSDAHTSGGSSGGAAVAVAAGLGPIGIASDGGGSTRIPAACNGVVGLKQSHGVIPHSQVQDAYGNLTYVTPMTRTVADTALMLQAMAGPHDSDPWSIGLPVQDYLAAAEPQGDLRGRRILYCATAADRPLAADVAAAFGGALRRLADLGAELIEMPADGFDVEPIWRAINHTTWRARFADMAARHPGQMSPTFLRQLSLAADISGADFQQAMFARTVLFRHVQSLLRDHDFIVTPTLTRTALPINQDLFEPIEVDGVSYRDLRPNWFPWTMPFNLTGHPAISLPCGFGAGGLPVGIQCVGRFRDDAGLLRLAALYEASGGMPDQWPALD
ncbi:MAG: amidase [Ferrovibrio sp.]